MCELVDRERDHQGDDSGNEDCWIGKQHGGRIIPQRSYRPFQGASNRDGIMPPSGGSAQVSWLVHSTGITHPDRIEHCLESKHASRTGNGGSNPDAKTPSVWQYGLGGRALGSGYRFEMLGMRSSDIAPSTGREKAYESPPPQRWGGGLNQGLGENRPRGMPGSHRRLRCGSAKNSR